MIDSPAEIVRSYRMAADPKKQIKVLAELNACSVKEIRQVLVGEGVLPRETEVPEEPKKAERKRFDEETARMLAGTASGSARCSWRGLRSWTSGSTYTARCASMRAASGP